MISDKKFEEEIPVPFKIEICCDRDHFIMETINLFDRILEAHNKRYDTKIEDILRHYVPDFAEKDEGDLSLYEYEMYVGGELVQKGKAPDEAESDINLEMEFYHSVVRIADSILDLWHDRIIKVQEENLERVKKLEEEGYDEVLYFYYRIRKDDRALLHLKRLAARYPYSDYQKHLRNVYRIGKYGHKINYDMVNKLNRRLYEEKKF